MSSRLPARLLWPLVSDLPRRLAAMDFGICSFPRLPVVEVLLAVLTVLMVVSIMRGKRRFPRFSSCEP